MSGLKSAILNNVDPLGCLSGKAETGGRLNVNKAIQTCSAPDFSISISPASAQTLPGGTATHSVTVNRIVGFSGRISLAVSGLHGGAAGTFNPSSTNGTTSTLTVTVASSVSAGNYRFTVTGTSGPLAHSASAMLTKRWW